MDMMLKVLTFFTDLVLPLSVGYLLRAVTRLRTEQVDRLIRSNIYVFFPLLSMFSLWGLDLDPELLWLPVMGIVMQVIPGGIGLFRKNRRYADPLDQGSYVLSMLLSNRGVVGSLSVFILFGEAGYAYARLVMLLGSVMVFLVSYPLAGYFSHAASGGEKESGGFRKILLSWNQLPLLGVIVGILLNLSGMSRPAVVSVSFDWLVHLSAWLSLLPVGFALNFREIRRYWKDIFEYIGIKYLVTPLLVFLIALPLLSNRIALFSVLVLSLSPTAINAVVTAKIYRLNVHITLSAFVTTTLLYLILVFPLLFVLRFA